eukprot:scaffold57019_cov69-Phaeocystis_antarctica.AAC.2
MGRPARARALAHDGKRLCSPRRRVPMTMCAALRALSRSVRTNLSGGAAILFCVRGVHVSV